MKLYGLKFEDRWLTVVDTGEDLRRYSLKLIRDMDEVPWFTTNYRMADEIAHHRGVGNSIKNPAMPGEFYMKIPKIVELEI